MTWVAPNHDFSDSPPPPQASGPAWHATPHTPLLTHLWPCSSLCLLVTQLTSSVQCRHLRGPAVTDLIHIKSPDPAQHSPLILPSSSLDLLLPDRTWYFDRCAQCVPCPLRPALQGGWGLVFSTTALSASRTVLGTGSIPSVDWMNEESCKICLWNLLAVCDPDQIISLHSCFIRQEGTTASPTLQAVVRVKFEVNIMSWAQGPNTHQCLLLSFSCFIFMSSDFPSTSPYSYR